MAAHIDQVALKDVARVIRMQRIDLRVFGAVEIVRIVALNGLVQKRKTEQQYDRDERERFYHLAGTPG